MKNIRIIIAVLISSITIVLIVFLVKSNIHEKEFKTKEDGYILKIIMNDNYSYHCSDYPVRYNIDNARLYTQEEAAKICKEINAYNSKYGLEVKASSMNVNDRNHYLIWIASPKGTHFIVSSKAWRNIDNATHYLYKSDAEDAKETLEQQLMNEINIPFEIEIVQIEDEQYQKRLYHDRAK